MSYMERLREHATRNSHSAPLTKLTEPGFVSFVSEPGRRVCEDRAAFDIGAAPAVRAFPSADAVQLPRDLLTGLDCLRTMSVPRIARPEVWWGIVADALRIVDEGWALQALQLGWNAMDLFGVDPSTDPDWQSLAVWLSRRRLVLIDERSVIAADADRRHVFTRRSCQGAVMLWEISDRSMSGGRSCR